MTTTAVGWGHQQRHRDGTIGWCWDSSPLPREAVNRTKPTDQQIAATTHCVTTPNPRQPSDSSRGKYLLDNVERYDHDDGGDHDRPVNAVTAPAACTSWAMSVGTNATTATGLFAIARSSSGSRPTPEDAEAPGIPRQSDCQRRSWHRPRLQIPEPLCAPPPRYLLVGLAGCNCFVLLYNASHFGSNAHLHHHYRDDNDDQA
jgi:hypothetical protein